MVLTSPLARLRTAFFVAVAAAAPVAAVGQAAAPTAPVGIRLSVTDARLAAALSRLLAGSPSATAVMAALAESGLPVSVGTPADLGRPAHLDGDADPGGALPDPSGLASPADPQLAWVALRVAIPSVDDPGTTLGQVDRVWVVVDADRIEALIRAQARPDADARVVDDLTIALAHELVAHVGSVARSRRVEDFCDDPRPGEGDAGRLACSIRMENTVRRELNRSLALHGERRYPERRSYALDVMNFAGAR